jgi:hypothetical protein
MHEIPLFVLNGLATLDGDLDPTIAVEYRSDGVALHHNLPGISRFLPTDRPPEPGCKVTALEPLGPLFQSPLVTRRMAGGGGPRAAAALSRRLRAEKTPGAVHVLSSSSGTPELDCLCTQTGMTCESLGRQVTPCNLIIPGPNRVIIKSPTAEAPGRLDDRHRQVIAQSSSRAGAIASVASRDGALTAAAVGTCNGARCYFQPTGALAPELALLVLQRTQEVLANLEESPEAPEAAADILRQMHRRHWAGSEGACCTLGRKGSVIADWCHERVYYVHLEMADGDPAVPTPAGAGDQFLGEYIFWRETWSKQGHLRDPLAATAVRATHAVAQDLGLRRDRYDVSFRLC